jgi:hypothetical protein
MVQLEHLYWGWKLLDWATLFALFAGPILAVLITLWSEKRRHSRQQQVQTMRMLISTRHLPGDPVYTQAINLVPIEFNRQSKIMAAWRAYVDVVRFKPQAGDEKSHYALVIGKQTSLVFQILQHLGYDLPENEIQTSAYAADGWIERDNISLDSQRAWRDIATALQRQNELTAIMTVQQPAQPVLSG